MESPVCPRAVELLKLVKTPPRLVNKSATARNASPTKNIIEIKEVLKYKLKPTVMLSCNNKNKSIVSHFFFISLHSFSLYLRIINSESFMNSEITMV